MKQGNPFALVRAADYSDEEINALWVELGPAAIDRVIEPRERLSKLIVGGKGAGKTHLLRYHSYPVLRLRNQDKSGLETLVEAGFLAVFLRATGIDAARFKLSSHDEDRWQVLFGIYLELRLAELVLDALCEIKESTEDVEFDDRSFINEIQAQVNCGGLTPLLNLRDLREWILCERRSLDNSVNSAAFSGSLEYEPRFAIGGLSITLGRALCRWHPAFIGKPLLYLIDEIENFSASQQKVINSLIRYGEGSATFRISGRHYSMVTFETIGGGEENREGAEYRKTNLDELLRAKKGFSKFATQFIAKRLAAWHELGDLKRVANIKPSRYFEEVDKSSFYEGAVERFSRAEAGFFQKFKSALNDVAGLRSMQDALLDCLTSDLPIIIGKVNCLKFCKMYSWHLSPITLADQIRTDSQKFISDGDQGSEYGVSYGHWSSDMFAQVCRIGGKLPSAPYAGFGTFVQMACGNPRNLLVLLGRAFALSRFRGIDFLTDGEALPIEIQAKASEEAAQFMFESDTNFGSAAESARQATARLAELLRTARYSLNVPEVAPIVVTFSDSDLSDSAREVLKKALNYSFIFEVLEGRPDRNSSRIHRKIQVNPLLSPRWGLPVGRRGDLPLNGPMVNAMFDPEYSRNFSRLLREAEERWDSPFKAPGGEGQRELFE